MKNIRTMELQRMSKILEYCRLQGADCSYSLDIGMGRLIPIISFLGLFLISCNGNDEKSDAYGNFEATEITISAQAAGELLQFNMEEGDFIKAGSLIGYVDTINLVLEKQQLFAQTMATKTQFSNLDAQVAVFQQQRNNVLLDMERIQKMFDDGAATQKQVDDVQGQVDVIDRQIQSVQTQNLAVNAELKVIHKQIEQVNESIKKSVIINPVDGVVLTKYMKAYEMAVMGQPLYKIADLREMELKVYVSGAQLPNIKIRQDVEVLVDKNKTENRKFTGTISWISESAEFTPKIIQTKEERVNLVYAVKVLVQNDGSLKIGMPGEVNF